MILEVNHVSRTFGGLKALNDVTFDLADGEILGLIGPNGAGKTTLFNCINGVYPPSEGQVIFRGQSTVGLPTYKVAHLGLARTHQIVRPLNDLSVRENVMVGACFGRNQHNKRDAARVSLPDREGGRQRSMPVQTANEDGGVSLRTGKWVPE